MTISDLVLREIHARFSPDDAREAERQLREAYFADLGEPAYARGRDRVQLAILKYADGKLDQFSAGLKLARSDWRDILMCAGLAHENWPEVLRAAGYPVP